MSSDYVAIGDELQRRIEALIPAHPEILQMDSVWGLCHIPEFKCDDLRPSLAQAGTAFVLAKKRAKARMHV